VDPLYEITQNCINLQHTGGGEGEGLATVLQCLVSKITLSLISIKALFVTPSTPSISDTENKQHTAFFTLCHYVMLRLYCYYYAECRRSDCRYAECRCAECRYSECRGALM
jgi:hypothetical protein